MSTLIKKVILFIQKINSKIKLGISLSIGWILIIIALYFVELSFGGLSFWSKNRNSNYIFTNYFKWNVVKVYTPEQKDLLGPPNSNFTILAPSDCCYCSKNEKREVWRPKYSFKGFVKLLLISFLIGLSISFTFGLLFSVIIFSAWNHRRNIWSHFQGVQNIILLKFKLIHPMTKTFVTMGLIICYSALYFIGISQVFILAVLALLFIIIPTIWFIFKKAIAGLVYDVTKAIMDAKK